MDPINPHFKNYRSNASKTTGQLFDELCSGNRAALARSITLAESKLDTHRSQAEELIHRSLPLSGNALRIGITGVPGVGKSTFIEAFGSYLTGLGKKVAVLAIDPTSTRNRGSILGDKTRMEKLSQDERAFIRPSPSSGSLGGVARKTRESIILCEAAGHDVIIVETVGVGQSETAVKSMVDFFLLLMLAGAGDELQGIKRGIMEMADLLVINKADGENERPAKLARAEYQRALHLFPPNENEWIPRAEIASALEKKGVESIWKITEEFYRQQSLKGHLQKNREEQSLQWFDETLGELLLRFFHEKKEALEELERIREDIRQKKAEPFQAAKHIAEKFFKK